MRSLSQMAATTLLLLAPLFGYSAASNYPLESMTPDHENLPSLQRGAAIYMNYCLGCHGLQHQRHNRTAADLGIPDPLYRENLLFADVDIGMHINTALPEAGAREWFGVVPPDLSMVTRARGADWVYTFLKSFYLDANRPFGVNNALFENVGMPHALIELQGRPYQVCDGQGADARDPLNPTMPVSPDGCIEVEDGTGQLSPDEYEQVVYDVVNFLDYTGEPYKQDRQQLGVFVLLFLLILFVFSYLLAREYKKDIH